MPSHLHLGPVRKVKSSKFELCLENGWQNDLRTVHPRPRAQAADAGRPSRTDQPSRLCRARSAARRRRCSGQQGRAHGPRLARHDDRRRQSDGAGFDYPTTARRRRGCDDRDSTAGRLSARRAGRRSRAEGTGRASADCPFFPSQIMAAWQKTVTLPMASSTTSSLPFHGSRASQ